MTMLTTREPRSRRARSVRTQPRTCVLLPIGVFALATAVILRPFRLEQTQNSEGGEESGGPPRRGLPACAFSLNDSERPKTALGGADCGLGLPGRPRGVGLLAVAASGGRTAAVFAASASRGPTACADSPAARTAGRSGVVGPAAGGGRLSAHKRRQALRRQRAAWQA